MIEAKHLATEDMLHELVKRGVIDKLAAHAATPPDAPEFERCAREVIARELAHKLLRESSLEFTSQQDFRFPDLRVLKTELLTVRLPRALKGVL
ncbi:hypothetical protein [Pyruvatibacter sp.]